MAGSKYLRLYNAGSAVLWSLVLLKTLILLPLVGFDYVAEGVAPFASYVQSLAILEVLHSLLGLVRSGTLTVAMQVASRYVLIWGIVRLFPSVAAHPAFTSMIVAWSITEIIRYPYYWCQLQGSVPKWLEWARYNLFIVLYPVGAGSETYLLLRSLSLATFYNPYYGLFLKIYLLIVPPAFYFLYTHMFKQRAKILYGTGKRASAKAAKAKPKPKSKSKKE